MTKGNKRSKPWESLLLEGTVKGEKATLLDIKHGGKGGRVSTALVEILARVLRMPVEEPIKYTFPDEKIANNFRGSLAGYAVRAKQDSFVHVTRCETTVYVYRKA